MGRGWNGWWNLLKDEPDIVKELREEEKLGGLHIKIQGIHEALETAEETTEDVPGLTTDFFEEGVVPKAKIDDVASENTEEVLQDAIARYRLIFDNVNDGIIYLDKHGKILEVNKRSVDIFGHKPEEIIGKNFAKVGFFGVKELPKMLRLFKKLISGKEIGLLELEVKHKDGHKTPVEASIRLIKKNGKTEGIVGIIRDITERKKSEEKIQRAAKEWQTTFDSISDLVSIMDKNYVILNANKAYIDTFNMKREELKGKHCYEIVHGSEKPFPGCPHLQTLKTKKPVTIEFFEPNLGIFLEVSTSPIFDENGEVVGSTHIAKNIAKRKKTEWALGERLKEFKCLYSVTNSIRSEKPLEELLVDTTNYIKDAWQYPDITRGRIRLDGQKYEGIKFDETKFKQKADIIVGGKTRGVVEVYYLEETAKADEGPFLKEERKLLDEIASYLGTHIEKIEVNKEKNKLLQDMSERVKEFNCLYGVSKLIENPDNSLYDIFQKTVELIPPSWRYPEVTCARIIFEGKEFKTPNFKETKWKQSSDIRISGKKEGIIEVYYLEEKPESAEGPFLKEEMHLIDGLAKQLGSVIKRMLANEDLKKKVDELEQHKKITVGRELKMVELKNRIKELEGEKLT